jgi:hypothetical protein
MKSRDIKQTIEIKTECMYSVFFKGLSDLINKYKFYFQSITEENQCQGMYHKITITAIFNSFEQMFDFNKELQEILINNN